MRLAALCLLGVLSILSASYGNVVPHETHKEQEQKESPKKLSHRLPPHYRKQKNPILYSNTDQHYQTAAIIKAEDANSYKTGSHQVRNYEDHRDQTDSQADGQNYHYNQNAQSGIYDFQDNQIYDSHGSPISRTNRQHSKNDGASQNINANTYKTGNRQVKNYKDHRVQTDSQAAGQNYNSNQNAHSGTYDSEDNQIYDSEGNPIYHTSRQYSQNDRASQDINANKYTSRQHKVTSGDGGRREYDKKVNQQNYDENDQSQSDLSDSRIQDYYGPDGSVEEVKTKREKKKSASHKKSVHAIETEEQTNTKFEQLNNVKGTVIPAYRTKDHKIHRMIDLAMPEGFEEDIAYEETYESIIKTDEDGHKTIVLKIRPKGKEEKETEPESKTETDTEYETDTEIDTETETSDTEIETVIREEIRKTIKSEIESITESDRSSYDTNQSWRSTLYGNENDDHDNTSKNIKNKKSESKDNNPDGENTDQPNNDHNRPGKPKQAGKVPKHEGGKRSDQDDNDHPNEQKEPENLEEPQGSKRRNPKNPRKHWTSEESGKSYEPDYDTDTGKLKKPKTPGKDNNPDGKNPDQQNNDHDRREKPKQAGKVPKHEGGKRSDQDDNDHPNEQKEPENLEEPQGSKRRNPKNPRKHWTSEESGKSHGPDYDTDAGKLKKPKTPGKDNNPDGKNPDQQNNDHDRREKPKQTGKVPKHKGGKRSDQDDNDYPNEQKEPENIEEPQGNIRRNPKNPRKHWTSEESGKSHGPDYDTDAAKLKKPKTPGKDCHPDRKNPDQQNNDHDRREKPKQAGKVPKHKGGKRSDQDDNDHPNEQKEPENLEEPQGSKRRNPKNPRKHWTSEESGKSHGPDYDTDAGKLKKPKTPGKDNNPDGKNPDQQNNDHDRREKPKQAGKVPKHKGGKRSDQDDNDYPNEQKEPENIEEPKGNKRRNPKNPRKHWTSEESGKSHEPDYDTDAGKLKKPKTPGKDNHPDRKNPDQQNNDHDVPETPKQAGKVPKHKGGKRSAQDDNDHPNEQKEPENLEEPQGTKRRNPKNPRKHWTSEESGKSHGPDYDTDAGKLKKPKTPGKDNNTDEKNPDQQNNDHDRREKPKQAGKVPKHKGGKRSDQDDNDHPNEQKEPENLEEPQGTKRRNPKNPRKHWTSEESGKSHEPDYDTDAGKLKKPKTPGKDNHPDRKNPDQQNNDHDVPETPKQAGKVPKHKGGKRSDQDDNDHPNEQTEPENLEEPQGSKRRNPKNPRKHWTSEESGKSHEPDYDTDAGKLKKPKRPAKDKNPDGKNPDQQNNDHDRREKPKQAGKVPKHKGGKRSDQDDNDYPNDQKEPENIEEPQGNKRRNPKNPRKHWTSEESGKSHEPDYNTDAGKLKKPKTPGKDNNPDGNNPDQQNNDRDGIEKPKQAEKVPKHKGGKRSDQDDNDYTNEQKEPENIEEPQGNIRRNPKNPRKHWTSEESGKSHGPDYDTDADKLKKPKTPGKDNNPDGKNPDQQNNDHDRREKPKQAGKVPKHKGGKRSDQDDYDYPNEQKEPEYIEEPQGNIRRNPKNPRKHWTSEESGKSHGPDYDTDAGKLKKPKTPGKDSHPDRKNPDQQNNDHDRREKPKQAGKVPKHKGGKRSNQDDNDHPNEQTEPENLEEPQGSKRRNPKNPRKHWTSEESGKSHEPDYDTDAGKLKKPKTPAKDKNPDGKNPDQQNNDHDRREKPKQAGKVPKHKGEKRSDQDDNDYPNEQKETENIEEPQGNIRRNPKNPRKHWTSEESGKSHGPDYDTDAGKLKKPKTPGKDSHPDRKNPDQQNNDHDRREKPKQAGKVPKHKGGKRSDQDDNDHPNEQTEPENLEEPQGSKRRNPKNPRKHWTSEESGKSHEPDYDTDAGKLKKPKTPAKDKNPDGKNPDQQNNDHDRREKPKQAGKVPKHKGGKRSDQDDNDYPNEQKEPENIEEPQGNKRRNPKNPRKHWTSEESGKSHEPDYDTDAGKLKKPKTPGKDSHPDRKNPDQQNNDHDRREKPKQAGKVPKHKGGKRSDQDDNDHPNEQTEPENLEEPQGSKRRIPKNPRKHWTSEESGKSHEPDYDTDAGKLKKPKTPAKDKNPDGKNPDQQNNDHDRREKPKQAGKVPKHKGGKRSDQDDNDYPNEQKEPENIEEPQGNKRRNPKNPRKHWTSEESGKSHEPDYDTDAGKLKKTKTPGKDNHPDRKNPDQQNNDHDVPETPKQAGKVPKHKGGKRSDQDDNDHPNEQKEPENLEEPQGTKRRNPKNPRKHWASEESGKSHGPDYDTDAGKLKKPKTPGKDNNPDGKNPDQQNNDHDRREKPKQAGKVPKHKGGKRSDQDDNDYPNEQKEPENIEETQGNKRRNPKNPRKHWTSEESGKSHEPDYDTDAGKLKKPKTPGKDNHPDRKNPDQQNNDHDVPETPKQAGKVPKHKGGKRSDQDDNDHPNEQKEPENLEEPQGTKRRNPKNPRKHWTSEESGKSHGPDYDTDAGKLKKPKTPGKDNNPDGKNPDQQNNDHDRREKPKQAGKVPKHKGGKRSDQDDNDYPNEQKEPENIEETQGNKRRNPKNPRKHWTSEESGKSHEPDYDTDAGKLKKPKTPGKDNNPDGKNPDQQNNDRDGPEEPKQAEKVLKHKGGKRSDQDDNDYPNVRKSSEQVKQPQGRKHGNSGDDNEDSEPRKPKSRGESNKPAEKIPDLTGDDDGSTPELLYKRKPGVRPRKPCRKRPTHVSSSDGQFCFCWPSVDLIPRKLRALLGV